jgi:hypothetical protein
MIYIYIGNHGYNIHTQDILEYVQNGLEEVGLTANFFFNKFAKEGINLVLEMFDENLTKSIIDFQKNSPRSKMFVIATESIAGNTFNSANNVQKADGQMGSHYEDANYWKARFDCFMRLRQVMSGIITIAEHQYKEYLAADLGVPIFYLPMVALPGIVPIRRIPFEKKDIDIYFSGTMTEYRARIFKRFGELGLHVVTASARNPEYLRRHFLERSKLALGLKLDESTRLLSKARAHYYLTRRCSHLFEPVVERTELDPFLEFSTHQDIVLATLHRLQSGCEFNEQSLEDFKKAHPFEEVFSSLNNFFEQSPTRI